MRRLWILVLFSLSLNSLAESPPAGSGIFPIAEVRPGLAAKGYSVFKGEEISSFDVEVIDVQQIGVIKEPMILCMLKGPFFEKNGVIAAMSGSPVYVGDKFLGAVAMGWAFSKDPICALTPAGQMAALYAKRSGGGAHSAFPGRTAADLRGFIDSMAERPAGRPGLPEILKAQGVSVSYGSEENEKMTAGEIVPGSMIGVQLVRGDIELTAFGTVSSVSGDSILAFGHSFFGLGEVDFPVVKGRVSAVLPSMLFSFKISSAKEEIGSMVFDSPYGVVVEKGRKAATLPVQITYRKRDGVTEKRQVSIVNHPDLSGMLLETAVALIHEQLEGTGKEIFLVVDKLRFDFEKGGSLEMPAQRFGGASPSGMMTAYIAETFSLLVGNIYKKEKVSGIDIGISAGKGREEGKLVELRALSSAIRKGDDIELEAAFIPFEGEKIIHRISVPTGSFPTGEIKVVAGDNLSVYKRVAAGQQEVPGDFGTLRSALGKIPPGGALVYAVLIDKECVFYGSNRAPDLPPSIQASLPASRDTSIAKAAEKVLAGPMKGPETGYFDGLLEVKINIREKE